MKKFLIILIALSALKSATYGISLYDPISELVLFAPKEEEKLFPESQKQVIQQPKIMMNGDISSWVSDINANNGHVTYTLNVQIPLENNIILAKTRRDYICAQDKEAILWGKAKYLLTDETIDYTPYIDKTKLKRYAPIDEHSTEVINQITPHCSYDF